MMVVLTEIAEQSSSFSFRSSTHDYDVFLSFRGIDTRSNFTDHLLKALHEASINTFFDDSEIRMGDFLKPELETAIKSSSASIIVLSKDYASSTWCLDELVLIMEQRRTTNHIVFPIFYHVKPSDVRKQLNSFGDAMAEHEQRMKAESDADKRCQLDQKIKKWKKALTDVADMKGEEANGRRETIIIEEIVKEISCRLELHKKSEIPYIIGMDSSIKEITSFIKDQSGQSIEIFTIWGMAGIGKTYLANYVFQMHYRDFESSCFLEEIERKCDAPNGLLDLQKKLLKDLQARSWMDIDNVRVGTSEIEKSLSKKRTFLVLDGINELEQLDVLLGIKGLHPGSKVIITSKNGSITEKCRLFGTQAPPKHMKHLLEGLDERKSLQLLSWHAFGRNEPNEGDNDKSMEVVKYCNGHPLALKVLGSSLRSEGATWDDILESLGNEVNPDITKVLKISYDNLPSEKDKELFKYIACFFVGEDRKFSEDVLKACGVCRSSGIKVLINRCLLTLGYPDKLMMHQLLQDMGRDIVRQESPKKPWKRSILWHHEECADVLDHRRGTPITQGLVFDKRTFEKDTSKEPRMQKFGFRSFLSFSWVHILLSLIWWLFGWVFGVCSSSRKTKSNFNTLALSKMCNLKLLQLNYVQLSGSYENFPQDLRLLCMHGFPLSYIPSTLKMDNMVALDMSYSKLKQLWKIPKLLGSLKFLNLSNCHELVRVGHFSTLPLLERLTLARCTSLVEVCESIGSYCKKLEVLNLSECNKLKRLPRTIETLKKLTKLLIDGCSNLFEFPAEMKSYGRLSTTMVPRSSKSLMSLLPSSLVELSLKDCNLYTESFPKDFSCLSMLKILFLNGNPIEYMPDCVRSLSGLEILSVAYCHSLKAVLCTPIRLKYLDLFDCDSLEIVTFHPEKSVVPEVTYAGINLTEIHEMFKLQALSEIDEEVLKSLGWINIEYLNYSRYFNMSVFALYYVSEEILPIQTQMLYEHGIFSTYLQGKEVPNWFTHRSNGSTFTLEASPKNGKIRGINVCVVHAVSKLSEACPFRIKIQNLSKISSWTYQPMMYRLPEYDNFENGNEVVVWLSHWMFTKNEFEVGDKVSIHFTVKYHSDYQGCILNVYEQDGTDSANVMEYGMSLVYDDDDDDDDGRKLKEDPLAYYKSWKYIIGGDLSGFEIFSDQYLLTSW